MPNICLNRLVVTGEPKKVQEFWELVRYVEPDGTVRINPAPIVGPEGYEPDEDDDLDWMARWGTPIFDVNPEPGYEGAAEDGSNGTLALRLQSKTVAPLELLDEIAKKRPDLTFELLWDEEFCEGAGYIKHEKGKVAVIEATDHPPFYRGADVLRRHGWQASAAYWEKNSEQGTEDFDRDLG